MRQVRYSFRLRYILNVMLDFAAHSASVDETITYQNSTGETLTELVLAVEPNLGRIALSRRIYL